MKNYKIIFLLVIIGLLLALWGVHDPFVGIYNTNNNYLNLAAKNFLRFGFEKLHYFPTYVATEQFVTGDPYYLHHPILVFWIESLFVFLFGSHNWVIHAPQFLFVVGSVFMLYKIAKFIWGNTVAMWTLGLSSVFPMTTFFWKFMQFEQASLFFNLVIIYIALSKKQLWLLFLFTLLSGFTDWGVLYLIPVFIILKLKKQFSAYIVGILISLGIFVASVYRLQGGFTELISAIWGRSYTAELTSLSFWPIRLLGISLFRIVLYFTPIALFALPLVRNNMVLMAFFVFGVLNFIFLPAASWGHSYFLYYFIPFFAWSGAIFLSKVKKKWLMLWLLVIVITSIIVNYLKIQQVKKQLWKYDAAARINTMLTPHEPIGVVNFPGDVFENYFLHPSQPMTMTQLASWQNGQLYPALRYTVIEGENTAQLISKEMKIALYTPDPVNQVKENSIIRLYRIIRDILSVGQI